MKIHFSTFGSSFYIFSSRTCTYAMQPNTLKWETSGFLPMNFSLGVMPCRYNLSKIGLGYEY